MAALKNAPVKAPVGFTALGTDARISSSLQRAVLQRASALSTVNQMEMRSETGIVVASFSAAGEYNLFQAPPVAGVQPQLQIVPGSTGGSIRFGPGAATLPDIELFRSGTTLLSVFPAGAATFVQFLVNRTTAFAATHIANFFRAQASPSTVLVENTNTVGAAEFAAVNDGGTSGFFMRVGVTSTAFVPVGGQAANEAYLLCSASNTGMVVGTQGALPLRFTITSVERGRFTSLGDFIMGAAAPLTPGEDIATFLRTQASPTRVAVVNTSAGVTAVATFFARNGATATEGFAFGVTGTGFTPTGGRIADGGFGVIGTGLVDLAFITTGANPIRIATTGLTRYTFGATGNLTMNGDFDIVPSVDDDGEVGTDALRFTRVRAVTIVSGDVELKNRDGSKHWVLSEGADAVFAVNRRTGRKYRLVLEEVAQVEDPEEVAA